MIITNSRYALVGYFITSYPTRAHGIIVNYTKKKTIGLKRKTIAIGGNKLSTTANNGEHKWIEKTKQRKKARDSFIRHFHTNWQPSKIFHMFWSAKFIFASEPSRSAKFIFLSIEFSVVAFRELFSDLCNKRAHYSHFNRLRNFICKVVCEMDETQQSKTVSLNLFSVFSVQ